MSVETNSLYYNETYKVNYDSIWIRADEAYLVGEIYTL